MIYYIADTHFGHENVIKHDKRPFENGEQMAKIMVERWNDTICDEDTVYIVGDAFWKNGRECIDILESLRGHKHLIRGNHDKPNVEMSAIYESIRDYAQIDDGGRRVVLSHYPILFYNHQHHGAYMLYGHVHNTIEWELVEKWKAEQKENGIPCEIINVGCMMDYMGYAPKSLNQLICAGQNKI